MFLSQLQNQLLRGEGWCVGWGGVCVWGGGVCVGGGGGGAVGRAVRGKGVGRVKLGHQSSAGARTRCPLGAIPSSN